MRFLAVIITFLCLYTIQAAVPVTFSACPPGEVPPTTSKMDCADISRPLDPANSKGDQINIFIRRIYKTSPTNKTVWWVNGGPGESTNGGQHIIDGVFLPKDPTVTGYMMDVRGTGRSNNGLYCSFHPPVLNPYIKSTEKNHTTCNNEIFAKFTPQKLKFYTIYNQMWDLKEIIDMIVAPSPSGTVSLWGESVGTLSLNIYLQIPKARADTVVLTCPITPIHWALEMNSYTSSSAVQDVMNTCVKNSAKCKNYIGDMAHIPKLTKEALVSGTLPCLSSITWLQGDLGNHLVSKFTNDLASGNQNKPLVAPFWFRLWRCNNDDINQLNYLYHYFMATPGYSTSSTPLNASDPYDFSPAVATNIGVGELYSFLQTPLTYEQVTLMDKRQLSIGGAEFTTSFAKDKTSWPKYEPNIDYYKKFAQPKVPTLILSGTFDVNTLNGMALWEKTAWGPNAQFANVPYLSHGLIQGPNTLTDCPTQIIADWMIQFGKNVNMSCLSAIPAPDFDGYLSATQGQSQIYFGTRDLWNDGHLVWPTPASAPTTTPSSVNLVCPTPASAPTTSPASPECDSGWSNGELAGLYAAIVIPLLLIFLAIFGIGLYICMAGKGVVGAGVATKNPITGQL